MELFRKIILPCILLHAADVDEHEHAADEQSHHPTDVDSPLDYATEEPSDERSHKHTTNGTDEPTRKITDADKHEDCTKNVDDERDDYFLGIDRLGLGG